jgi:hypothetical protein
MNRQVSDTDAYYIPIGSVMVSSQNTVHTTGATEGADDLSLEQRVHHMTASHRKSPVEQTPDPYAKNFCGMSPRTQTKMFLVWLLAVGVVAAIFYGLYVLGIFLWCQLEAGKVTDFCLARRIAS